MTSANSYLVIGIAILVIAFVIWRASKAERRELKRDEAVLPLLAPIAIRLAGHQDVAQHEVAALASIAHVRPALFEMLQNYGHSDLFPAELTSLDAQAEGILAHSVMHPNERGEAPVAIEFVSTIDNTVNGREAHYFEMRFRMKDGSAATDEWTSAVVGPLYEDAMPYLNEASTLLAAEAEAFIARASHMRKMR